jgi:hypothetical protein
VDILHEFDLGVWKSILEHLIRILNTLGDSYILEMNCRFKEVPAFGRDTMRKITYDVSELPKLAARDYEDLLQVKYFHRECFKWAFY